MKQHTLTAYCAVCNQKIEDVNVEEGTQEMGVPMTDKMLEHRHGSPPGINRIDVILRYADSPKLDS